MDAVPRSPLEGWHPDPHRALCAVETAIAALGKHGGSDMFDITICHPLSPALNRDGMDNSLRFLKKAWDEKISRFGRVPHESSTSVKLFGMSLSSLGGWHPDSHRAMGSIAINIASQTLSSVHYAPSTMLQKRSALLVARNAACFSSGFDFQI